MTIASFSFLAAGAVSWADETMAFARRELGRFLSAARGGEGIAVDMRTDPSLAQFSFSVRRDGNTLVLRGHASAEVLQAAYTALELLGYRFEVTGPVAPTQLEVAAIPGEARTYTPFVRRRGVRQHINFCMDVSSYPLEEAKEYIRNLARLRYNWMVFHSYPGHWTRDKFGNAWCSGEYRQWMSGFALRPDDLATGAFFYGDDIRIPNHPFMRKAIRFNKDYFCAPCVEDVIHTCPDRGERMTKWLAELIAEAKRCGMAVQFSTEIRECDNEYNVGLANRILEDYPGIDVLEFITREGGGSREMSAERRAKQLAYFREITEARDDAACHARFRNEPADCERQVKDFAYIVKLVNYLKEIGWASRNSIRLAAGAYCTEPTTAQVIVDLAEAHLPEDVWFTLMPGHGSRVVFEHFSELKVIPELLARTMVHSWIEFDGYMMLQQHAGRAIYELARRESTILGGGSVPAIMFNHWRTAPNNLAFRYVGEMAFDGRLTAEKFAQRYASAIGLAEADVAAFVDHLATIDAMSDQRAIAGNIGFPLLGMWKLDTEKRQIGAIWWWGPENVEKAADTYEKIAADLEDIATRCTTDSGRRVLHLVAVGAELSGYHLRGVRQMQYIPRRYFNYNENVRRMPDPADLTPEDRKFIIEHCNRAQRYFTAYIRTMAENLFDRGEEGMLLTYYWGPATFCNNVRAFYGGEGRIVDVNAQGEVLPIPLGDHAPEGSAR